MFRERVLSHLVSTGSRHLRRVLSDAAVESAKPVLLLDFDGTVSLGDGPVLAYAQKAFALLPADRRIAAADQLAGYLGGDPELLRRYADGYDCVRDRTIDYLTPDQLSAAYLTSRRRLAVDGLDTYPAPGIVELLTTLGGAVTRVVLTNSPAIGVFESLERFGLADLLDEVVVGADKPHRMAEHVDVLTAGRLPATLISVGDHWTNDLAVPVQRGCATAYVSKHPGADEPVNSCAPDLVTLVPEILVWAEDPVAFVGSGQPIAVWP